MHRRLDNKTVSKISIVMSTLLLIVQIIYVTAVYKVLVKNGAEVTYMQMWLAYLQTTRGITALLITVSGYVFALMRSRLK